MSIPQPPGPPWLPPEPGTHDPFLDPPAAWWAAEEREHQHRPRRHRLAALACLAGFALGATGVVVAVEANRSSSTASSVTVTVPATSPGSSSAPSGSSAGASTVPASSDVPATTSAGDPTSTTTAPDASTTRTSHSLTTGLVIIDTVLGYEDAQAAGTGIVLTSSGDILTNNHVIDGATKIRITIVTTGTSYDATVVGTDPTEDVAVIHATDASGLAVAPLGDSSAVKVGDAVSAIGNAGGTGTPTTTTGQVLALEQTITATDETGGNAETLHHLIEISASLQPGDSGGPLYDSSGKVIGIDSAGNSGSFSPRRRSRSASTGSTEGFAIPITQAVTIATQIESGQASDTITIGTPPLLGIGITSQNDTGVTGVVVRNVATGTGAEKIGLQVGDVITKIGTTSIASQADVTSALKDHKAGDQVNVTWVRNGTTHHATATLVAGPAN